MAWRVRKSVSVAGIRFNFGKTGLTSVSTGVRGFRVTTGKHGTRVTVGIPGTGISYTEKLGTQAQSRPVIQNNDLLPGEQAIQTATAADLKEISSQELIDQINQRANRFPLVSISITIFLLLFLPIWVLSGIAFGAFSLVSAGVTWWAYRKDIERRTTHLDYELDSAQREAHNRVCQSIACIGQSQIVWHTLSQQSANWKHHGGASTLIRRHCSTVNGTKLPRVTTNVDVPSITGSGIKLFFLPDQVLVWQDSKYSTISYQNLLVKVSETRFVESEFVPNDAEVVGSTWLHPNRNGGPDRRFSDNRQIPIVQYGVVEFSIPAGIVACYQVSSRALAYRFGEQWEAPAGSVVADELWHKELVDTPTPADYAGRILEIFDVTTVEELEGYNWPFTTVEEAEMQFARLNHQWNLLDMLKREVGAIVERLRISHVPQEEIDRYTAMIEAADIYIDQVTRVRQAVENCLRDVYEARARSTGTEGAP